MSGGRRRPPYRLGSGCVREYALEVRILAFSCWRLVRSHRSRRWISQQSCHFWGSVITSPARVSFSRNCALPLSSRATVAVSVVGPRLGPAVGLILRAPDRQLGGEQALASQQRGIASLNRVTVDATDSSSQGTIFNWH